MAGPARSERLTRLAVTGQFEGEYSGRTRSRVAPEIPFLSPGSLLPACARLLGPALLAVLAALALSGAPHAAVSQTLYGGFDADGNIRLTFADGTPIGTPSPPGTLIPAGTYTIVVNNNGVDDLGNPHEFELSGPGVSLSAGQATQLTWTATFQPASTYVYEDALNPTTEYDVFGTPGSGAGATTTVAQPVGGSSGTPSSGSTGTTPAPTDNNPVGTAATPLPYRGTLTAAVSKAGKLSLTWKGKNVATLTKGRYTLAVTDKSSKSGFVLQEIHQAAINLSGIGFVGTRKISVDLTAGQWFFYPTFVGKKTYFIVIS